MPFFSTHKSIVKDTGTGEEREGFQGKMQHKKWKGTRMFLRSKYANRKWNLLGGNMGASRGL